MLWTSAAGLVTYKYDSSGLLYRRLGVANDGEVIFENTEYIYDENGQLVVEIDNIRNTKTKYIRSIDGEISKTIDKNNNLMNYYIYNLRGDVYRLANADGQVTAEYKYDAYGNVISSTGNSAGSNYMRYCGEYYDKYTQCIYLRARMYNPKLMQFMQQDSYLGDVGSVASRNLYTYCSNDPINNCDPTGHWGGKIHREITSKALKDFDTVFLRDHFKSININVNLSKLKKFFSGKDVKVPKRVKNFKRGIIIGCTLPDDFRGKKKSEKPDPYFEKYYPDSNDVLSKGNELTGFWHGASHTIYEHNHLNIELDKARKKFTNKKCKKAGVKLGCILHAVQDVEAHRYNYTFPKKDDALAQDYIMNNLQSSLKSAKKMKKNGKKTKLGKQIYKRVLKKDGIFILRDDNKTPSKNLHQLLSDNPYADYGPEGWFFVRSKKENQRYNDSILCSASVIEEFSFGRE